jgi:hypothetical protein
MLALPMLALFLLWLVLLGLVEAAVSADSMIVVLL